MVIKHVEKFLVMGWHVLNVFLGQSVCPNLFLKTTHLLSSNLLLTCLLVYSEYSVYSE